MSPLEHVVQVLVLGALVVGVGAVFVALIRADLRANPPMPNWTDHTGEDDDEDAEVCEAHDFGGPPELCTCDQWRDVDPGAEWDRARDRDLDYRTGAA
ncbi:MULTISPECIES: hypothetical protein [Nocardia]|uniref:hypothetical protein n=1 Tax=Nocardia TaxID=1817 RepID=UPI0007A3B3BB|nr:MULTISPECIES: hypothetical protein [Nocardia]